jgi:hypothetical protein
MPDWQHKMINVADFRGAVETKTALATYVVAIAMEPKRWSALASASDAKLCGRSSITTGWHALRHCVNVGQFRPNNFG